MIDYFETKQHPITRKMVLDAFRLVRANQGAAGVDEQSIGQFEKGLEGNIYRLWNRMTSGSYFPSPVREVEIPKKTGGFRKLGVPTVSDRIAQQVVKSYLEPRIDPSFHADSYGYRPGKNAHQAIHTAMTRCGKIGWVLDLDIKSFFDEIDHELMLKAVLRYTKEKWVVMYLDRWLKADVKKADGTLVRRDKGTPQGGPISSLMANLFLHFTFDKWMELRHPNCRFERYCDDIIVHCVSQRQAEFIKGSISDRLRQCKLRLNDTKTQIVYCRNERNREKHGNASFDFLGYTFRPRYCPTKEGIKLLTAACMSESAKNEVRDKIRKMAIRKFRGNIQQLSGFINSKIRGWVNYYCKFHKWTTVGLWWWLNGKLIEWVRCNKRIGSLKAIRWLEQVGRTKPDIFAHWQILPIKLGKR